MVGALLLVLAAVLVGRTLTFRSVQPRVSPVGLVKVDRQAALRRLAAAIRLRTISHSDPARVDPAPYGALREQLAAAFPRIHRRLRREIINGHSLLYTWTGREPDLDPLLLLAHVDVVPVDPSTRSEWTHPPFSGAIAGGYLWGRGTLDDKGSALAMLEAAEHLLSEGFTPRRTVIIALGHDEEVGGRRGAVPLARHLARHFRAQGSQAYLAVDEGLVITRGIIPGIRRPVAVVGIAEKGYVTLELTVAGEGGHSSMPPPPPTRTAVGRLGRALARLEDHPMAARLEGTICRTFDAVGPEMPFAQRLVFANRWLFGPLVKRRLVKSAATNAVLRSTFAPTVLEASPQENVLAQRARALVNVRIHPRDSIAAVTRHARLVIGDPRVRVRPLPDGASEPLPAPAPWSSGPTPGYRLVARTIRQVFPDALVAPGLMVGMTDSRHYREVAREILRFAPLRIDASDRARFHGVNERISTRNYHEAITFYAQLIRNAEP